jgi:hypothetical protein
MSVHRITVKGNSTVRLPTAGKYCDRDIVITAEGGSVELPDLSDPGEAADLMAGKQLIDGEGKIVDGTFTIEEEITEQDALIEQINSALQRKTVGSGLPTQEKTVEITENGTHEIVPDEGYTLSKVTVNADVPVPDGYIVPSGTLEVTENGTYDVTEKASVVVSVPEREVKLQNIEVTENGTYSADSGYDGIGQVTVNVESSGGGGLTIDGILTAVEPVGAIVSEITKVKNTAQIANLFAYNPNITSVRMPNVTNVTNCPSFRDCKLLTDVYIPSVTTTTAQAFNGTGFSGIMDLSKMFPNLKTLAQTTFNNLNNVNKIILPATVTTVNANAFNTPMRGLTDIVFLGKPTTINATMVAAGVAPNVADVYVPWAEGEVANAPWGATNATIHYNYTYTEG